MLRSRRLQSLLIVLGLGLGFALLFWAQNVYRGLLFKLDLDLYNLTVEALTRFLLYTALAPAVGALVARWPLERGRLARRWPLHIAAAVSFAALHAVGMGVVYRLLHIYPPKDSLGEAIGRLLMTFFAVNFVVFWAISGAYHTLRYHREALAREQQAVGLKARLAEARLEVLRAQLHPHFLFNTLNAVSTLALTGQREAVVRTLSQLSDLLRGTLDPDLPQEVDLEHELGWLEGYLDIQRTRFGDRLAIVPEISAEARAGLLPTMLLQPLVENALRHGIEARPGPGRVTIGAQRRNERLCVRVEDTGPGFAPSGNGAGPHLAAAGNGGIGLSNTRARLETLYGAAHSITLGNLPGGGAYVEVTLPWHTQRGTEVRA